MDSGADVDVLPSLFASENLLEARERLLRTDSAILAVHSSQDSSEQSEAKEDKLKSAGATSVAVKMGNNDSQGRKKRRGGERRERSGRGKEGTTAHCA